MAGGRRLGARARREGGGFYSWAQGGGGASLCAKATKPWCGLRHAGVRWKGGGDRRPMAALGRRGVAGTHAPRGSAKDPQTSRTGTKEQGARTTGRRPASACVYGRHGGTPTRPGASSAGTLRARGALALAQFKVALFDQAFLEFLLQK
jgi:hypothetical protein